MKGFLIKNEKQSGQLWDVEVSLGADIKGEQNIYLLPSGWGWLHFNEVDVGASDHTYLFWLFLSLWGSALLKSSQVLCGPGQA